MTQAQLAIIKDAGYSLCPSCGGSGELSLGQPSAPEQMGTCHKCKGTGLAKIRTKKTAIPTGPCPYCRGEGEEPIHGGSYRTCNFCKGTGKR